MDREGAETYLRLLAEAELRRAVQVPAGGIPGRWHSARLALAAQTLTAVGAVGAGVADQIRADAGLAVAARHGTGYLPAARSRQASGRCPGAPRGGSSRRVR